MNDQEKLEQAMQIFNEIALTESADNGEESYTFSYSEIKDAAARILEMSKPRWYYPEKGELPQTIEDVWFCLPDNDVVQGSYFDRAEKSFMDSERMYYEKEEVKAWTYVIIPTPPTERSPGDE